MGRPLRPRDGRRAMLQNAIATGSVMRPAKPSARSGLPSVPKRPARWFAGQDVGRVSERPAPAARSTRCGLPKDQRRCSRRASGGGKGWPDPAHPETARPWRASARGRRVQPDAMGVRRAAGVARSAVVDQGDHRTADLCLAASQQGPKSRRTQMAGPTRAGASRYARLTLIDDFKLWAWPRIQSHLSRGESRREAPGERFLPIDRP